MIRFTCLTTAAMLSLAACGGGGGSSDVSTPVNEWGSLPQRGLDDQNQELSSETSLVDEIKILNESVIDVNPAPYSTTGYFPSILEATFEQVVFSAPNTFNNQEVDIQARNNPIVIIDVDGDQKILYQQGLYNDGILFVNKQDNSNKAFLDVSTMHTDPGLSYTALGEWNSNAVDDQANYSFVWGLETPSRDMPTVGSAIYGGGGSYAEALPDGRTVYGLNVTFAAADFGAGTMRTSVNLIDTGGSMRTLRSGDMQISGNRFGGGLTGRGDAAAYTGSAEGRFFGPGAAELGGTFEASGPTEIRGSFAASRTK